MLDPLPPFKVTSYANIPLETSPCVSFTIHLFCFFGEQSLTALDAERETDLNVEFILFMKMT